MYKSFLRSLLPETHYTEHSFIAIKLLSSISKLLGYKTSHVADSCPFFHSPFSQKPDSASKLSTITSFQILICKTFIIFFLFLVKQYDLSRWNTVVMYPKNGFINYVNKLTAAVFFQTKEVKRNDNLTELNSRNLNKFQLR
jgi:amino acid transporter